jgi:hypothetical protein
MNLHPDRGVRLQTERRGRLCRDDEAGLSRKAGTCRHPRLACRDPRAARALHPLPTPLYVAGRLDRRRRRHRLRLRAERRAWRGLRLTAGTSAGRRVQRPSVDAPVRSILPRPAVSSRDRPQGPGRAVRPRELPRGAARARARHKTRGPGLRRRRAPGRVSAARDLVYVGAGKTRSSSSSSASSMH